MPRKYYKKRAQHWTEVDINNALKEIDVGKHINATARKYGMNEGTLRYRIKKRKIGVEIARSGRKPALNSDLEWQLRNCIATLCEVGFSPSQKEIIDLVEEYVSINEINVSQFKDGKPGVDWFHAFMKRNNLSLKKANMIRAARKSATANPFVIYDFYEQLESIITTKNLSDTQIWNCYESGFPNDPHKCRVASVKGNTSYKVTCGAQHENITTLAVVSAAGRALDPFIVFAGKNKQFTWRGDSALPNTFYGQSESGWMTSDVFSDWFGLFCETITERPLLLILDGHLTQVSIPLIEKAMAENITILKLPPHVLQPLDVSCFGPFTRTWEQLLNKWVNEHGAKEPIRKGLFENKLGEVWHQGLSPGNIKAGFTCTGIFPVNPDKYPTSRFDSLLLRRYNAWVAAGKPDDIKEDMAKAANTPYKMTPINDKTKTPSTPSLCNCSLAEKLGPVPIPTPDGMEWRPVWSLFEKAVPPSTSSSSGMNKSFDELLLDKGPTDKAPLQKRKKIDFTLRCYCQTAGL